jgi:hypothetical protein
MAKVRISPVPPNVSRPGPQLFFTTNWKSNRFFLPFFYLKPTAEHPKDFLLFSYAQRSVITSILSVRKTETNHRFSQLNQSKSSCLNTGFSLFGRRNEEI